MRPTKLLMSAFGPYADVVEIDFDALGTSGVYLVCGDTGAGKTMIFDAICFALFGEASGDSKGGARSTSSMRSDYAPADSKTFVELSFMYRGGAYRIKRNPEYERAKSRGAGTTKQKADAEMELPDGRVVTGVRKVNAEVEELLGIDSEQFKQIVMLAQGEFRKLLTADTETRQVIFRKLFGTERYEMLQERLAEESRMLERENARVKTQVATLAQQVRFPAGSTLAQQADELRSTESRLGGWLQDTLEQLLANDLPAHDKLEQTIDELRVKWSEANALLKQIEGRPAIEQEKTQLASQVEALKAAAPALAAAFDEQKRRDGERATISERAAIVEKTFGKYEELQRAQAALAEARTRNEAAKAALEGAIKEDGAARALRARLAEEHAQLEGADVRLVQAQAVFESASARVSAAQKRLSDAEELSGKCEQAKQAGRALEAKRDAKARAEAAEKQARQARDEAQAKHDAFSDVPTALAEAAALCSEAERKTARAHELEGQRAQLEHAVNQAKDPYEHALRDLSAAEAAHAADAHRLQDLQRRQRAGRAGLLAAELEDGMPCPVCGSTHHPAPASTGVPIPTDEEIDAASAQAERSARKATDTSLAAEGLKATFDERQAQLSAFDEAHGGAKGVQAARAEADEQLASAKAAKAAADSRKRDAEAAAQALKAAQAEHDKAASSLASAEAAFQAAREQLILAENTAATLRATLGTLDEASARADFEKAQQAQAEARANLDAARLAASALEAKQAELTQAQMRVSDAAGALEQAKEAMQRASTAHLQTTERVAHLKTDLEFASLDQAREEAARLRGEAAALKATRDAAERAFSENASALATKEALLSAKTKQLADMPVADIDATRATMEDYRRDAERLKVDRDAIKTRIDANQGCLDALNRALAKAGDIEERYGRVKLLADVATGNLAGQAKVRFEAYVQAIYFDKVIIAANERLKVLTSGQFELVRYSEGTGNAKAGLGLYVIDSFTGRARDASSLSGGESFQASLCLALGLSDIVQAHAGGIEFDTMFVDEGFGSLDQGALGNAISLLSDLSGSTKLVGIISHVEDLKANIPKKILVSKTRHGSSVVLET